MGIKCDKCENEFMDSKALQQHTNAKHASSVEGASLQVSTKALKRIERKEERKAERAGELRSARNGKFLKYGVFLVMIIGVGYYLTNSPPSNPSGTAVAAGQGQNPEIPTGPIHWHPQLKIIISGQQQAIPPNIGIGPSAHQPIHTHEDELVNGARLLHMENDKPTAENMKLGFFFNVWGKKFNKDCIFEFCSSGDKKLKFTVNGKENADFENYSMRDGDQILVEYG